MRHLRTDWQGIQDMYHWQHSSGEIPCSSIEDDEPVFLVRAKDKAASATVRFWARTVRNLGGDPDLCDRVERWADEMDEYRLQHFDGGKVPDAPELLP